MKRCVIVIFSVIASVSNAYAGHVVSGGVADGEEFGLELSLGYEWKVDRFRFLLNYASGVMHGEETTRYQEEEFSNGQTTCRDTTNGQFAEQEKCDPVGFEYAPAVEARYSLGGSHDFGLGFRAGEESTIYATYLRGIDATRFWQIKVGSEYAAVAFGWQFN